MNIKLILALSLLLVSCSKTPDSSIETRNNVVPTDTTFGMSAALGEPFEVKVGREVWIQGEELTVRFISVPSDSRCPQGASCPWAGDAVVALNVGGSADSLHTSTQQSAAKHKTFTIKLLQLSPYPVLGVPLDPAAYVARLVITKNS